MTSPMLRQHPKGNTRTTILSFLLLCILVGKGRCYDTKENRYTQAVDAARQRTTEAVDGEGHATFGDNVNNDYYYYDEVSYVIEPFEYLNQEYRWSYSEDAEAGRNSNIVSISTKDAAFETSAFHIQVPEGNDSVFVQAILANQKAEHNCRNADYISLWYKPHIIHNDIHNDDNSKNNVIAPRLEITLFDSSCTLAALSEAAENQNSTTTQPPGGEMDDCQANGHGVLQIDIELPVHDENTPFLESNTVWQEVRAYDFQTLDPQRIKGYKVELMNSTFAYSVMIDQLACIGGGHNMFANPLYIADHDLMTFDGPGRDGIYSTEFYQSELSRNLTSIEVENGTISMDYTVMQTEPWGGFLSFRAAVPAAAHYNFSGATELVFDYNVLQAASEPGRVSLRVILEDTSDYNVEEPGQQEKWYSFHAILDVEGPNQLRIPLVGDTEPGSSFWLTGWAGGLGNSQLDVDHIESITIEINMDSVLGIGSIVSGAVELSNIQVVSRSDYAFDDSLLGDTLCTPEGDVHFNETSVVFTRYEYKAHQCCKICEDDPDCLYAVTTGSGHCYTAPYLNADDIDLANTVTQRTLTKSFWMDDSAKRGHFCQVCDCDERYQTIDCSGKDLAILPKFFPEQMPWRPKILDLRNNEKLVFVGSGSFPRALTENLQVILLGSEMRHFAESILIDLPTLRQVSIGDDDDAGDHNAHPSSHALNNIVCDQTESFSDVCCGLGETLQVGDEDTLTFCDMRLEEPGIDSLYMPHIELFDATPLDVLRPSTKFMGEAADSPEMCAAYCSINKACRYFGYDSRFKNAEHVCYLLKDKGLRRESICCGADDYADAAKTIPGYVSGMPPQTRHDEGNATVLISRQDHEADIANGYTIEYTVSLASRPFRGAVWIQPEVAGADSTPNSFEAGISISPSRVVLYDATQVVTVRVTVNEPHDDTVVLIANKIMSCDTAFTLGDPKDQIVYVSVKNEHRRVGVAIGFSLLATIVLVLPFLLWMVFLKRGQDEAFWKVDKSELTFDVPPRVLGRGSFGLVILGEYRGTKVAVKRVLPSTTVLPISEEMTKPRQEDEGQTFDIENNRSDCNSTLESPKGKDVAPKLIQRKASVEILRMSFRPSFFNSSAGGKRSSGDITRAHTHPRGSWETALAVEDSSVQKKLKKEFINELSILSKLRHPCITTVMGAVVERGIDPMLVMEYMAHGSLYGLLHNETMAVEGELLLPILCDITQGMRFLHSANPVIIHGDLKAQNILIDSKWRAKVADFGLSNKNHIGGTGTPYFMAPELLRRESPDTTATDVYSFGMILYEVFSRKEPYEGEDPIETLRQIADKNIRKRPPVPGNCPPQVQAMMIECLRDDPNCRPFFEELDERLKREHIDDIEPSNRHSSPREKTERRVSLEGIFPEHVATAINDGRSIEPEHHDCVTVFFCNVVDFTSISSSLAPEKVANLLSRFYSKLDSLSQKHEVFKVETVGDAYMAVTNLVATQENDHVKRIAAFSIEAIEAAHTTPIDEDDPSQGMMHIRVGFHCGPVVSDVVGTRNPRYCLFGDCVNVAMRLEANSEADRIHCSTTAAEILMDQYPAIPLRSRGNVPIKGKGTMHTFWVNEQGPVLSPQDQQPKPPRRSDSYCAPEDRTMLDWAVSQSNLSKKSQMMLGLH